MMEDNIFDNYEGYCVLDADNLLDENFIAEMNKMFDKTGTYTVVDGQIQITIGDKTFTSTFDETTGTYTLVYELQGQDGVFTPELTFSIWE